MRRIYRRGTQLEFFDIVRTAVGNIKCSNVSNRRTVICKTVVLVTIRCIVFIKDDIICIFDDEKSLQSGPQFPQKEQTYQSEGYSEAGQTPN